MTAPRLETDRLILRAPRAGDEVPFIDWKATERARYAGGCMARADAWRAFASMIGHWTLRGYGMFTLETKVDGTVIGIAGPWFPEGRPEREIGWSLFSTEHEGQGLAAEAAFRSRAFAYAELGWTTAVSNIAPANARSIALAERMGAVPDPDAVGPFEGDLVYRHPAPEALQ